MTIKIFDYILILFQLMFVLCLLSSKLALI